MDEHGTRRCYVKGCRRPECVAANTEYVRERRRQQGVLSMEDRYPEPPHGTITRYYSPRFRCRCDLCKAANTKHCRERALRRKAKAGEPVPAAEVEVVESTVRLDPLLSLLWSHQ